MRVSCLRGACLPPTPACPARHNHEPSVCLHGTAPVKLFPVQFYNLSQFWRVAILPQEWWPSCGQINCSSTAWPCPPEVHSQYKMKFCHHEEDWPLVESISTRCQKCSVTLKDQRGRCAIVGPEINCYSVLSFPFSWRFPVGALQTSRIFVKEPSRICQFYVWRF